MHLCSGTIRAPQAEEKLSAGFEFEKQMKKFNDVELALPAGRWRRRRGTGEKERAREWILPRIKLLLNPKVDGGTDILCYSYLRTSSARRSADICGHESR